MILYRLIESYYNLLYMHQSVLLIQARLGNVQNNYAEAVESYEKGALTKITLLKSEAELKKGKMDLRTMEDNYQVALDNFTKAYGVDPYLINKFFSSGEVDMEAQINALNLPEPLLAAKQVTEKAFQSNIELMLARKQWALSQAGVSRVRANEAPQLILGTGFSFDALRSDYKNVGDAFEAPFGEDSNISFFLNITLSGKIFDAAAGNNRVKQTESSLEQSILNLKQKEEEVKWGAEILVKKLTRGQENKEYMKLNREIASFEYEIGLKDYERGLISHVGLTALKISYDSSVLESMKPEIEYSLSQLELLMFMGQDLESVIQRGVNYE